MKAFKYVLKAKEEKKKESFALCPYFDKYQVEMVHIRCRMTTKETGINQM